MATTDSKVDVILPTHHRPHTVGFAIQSILNQTHSDFEVHVVGDGTTRETEEVVRSIDDPRVRFYAFPKGFGLGYGNRNTVLKQTRAPFVAYLSDDDLWFSDHLELAIKELTASGDSLVAFRYGQVVYPDTMDPCFFALDWRLPVLSDFLRNWFIGASTSLHRREVFDRIGYWDAGLFRFGDRDFYNRVRRSGLGLHYVDEITLLRFFALEWQKRYRDIREPPQQRYLDYLQDPTWCAQFRGRAGPGPRSLEQRLRQGRDFASYAFWSGPKFARYVFQKLARPARLAGDEPSKT